MPTTYTEAVHPSDWLKGEQDGPLHYSREQVTILAGDSADRELTSGMVCGKATKGAATSAAKAGGNTGGGAMGAVTVGAEAVAGVYTLRIVEAASGAGRFHVKDPAGDVVGEGNVAVAFSGGGLSFTLADGTPDFAVGDGFDITVAAGTGKVVQIDFSGATGIEDAYGILFDDVTAPDGVDAEGVLVVRNAYIDPVQITWPAGATAGQKAAALAQLAANGIIQRKGE